MMSIRIILCLVSFLLFEGSLGQKCADYKRPLRPGSSVSSSTKQFLNCWGNEVESGQSELVVLIDESGSMRRSGFKAAKDFVSSLLSEVRVAFNATRIAIGTFNRGHRIDFNYILNPSFANHKCKFVKDFEGVKFDGGMTNLKGALQDAENVYFRLIQNQHQPWYRKKSNKVVMVLSDGYGNVVGNNIDWINGRNVATEAQNLRQIGFVEVYTVAVTPGSDQHTLKSIATDPTLYIYQPSFNSLQNLAKNIRGDPYEKDYETFEVPQSACGTNSCDANAKCGCNLKSGKYRCVCRRGYYGTGEKLVSGSSCQVCPVDTYGDKEGLLTACVACPPNSGTNGQTKKFFLSDCSCKIGYQGNPSIGLTCTKKVCPPAPSINNGFIYNTNECSKSNYLTNCHYRCNPKYKLVDNSVLQCNHQGKWSGTLPVCKLLECPATFKLDTEKYRGSCNQIVNSGSNSFPVDTVCTFTCKDGYYHHGGDKTRTCQQTQTWTGDLIDCREVRCPKVPKDHKFLSVADPSVNCFENNIKVNERCEFTCSNSYELRGPTVLVCLSATGAIGKWQQNITNNPPTCADITKPNFANNSRCDNGITITNNTAKGKNYGLINFDAIGVTDNSGDAPVVQSTPPGYELGRTYQINYTIGDGLDINFKASDAAGNFRICRFKVKVSDNEKPTVVECPGNKVEKTSNQKQVVTWKEPVFSDNCGIYPACQLTTISNIASGSEFSQGPPTTVIYTVRDPSGNTQEDCRFTVKLEAPTCPYLKPPVNGLLAKFGHIAMPQCQMGFYPDKNFAVAYTCQNAMWLPIGQGAYPIPDCLQKTPPSGLNQLFLVFYVFNGDCNSNAAQEKAKTNFQNLGLLPAGASRDEIEVHCGATSVKRRRRRRSTKQLSFRIKLKVSATKEQAIANPSQTITDLKNTMNNNIAPAFLSNINSRTDWSKLSSDIQSLEKPPRKEGNPTEACAQQEEVFDKQQSKTTEKCVTCGSGQFKNVTTGECEKCPPGTYQPHTGKTFCVSCPEGSTSVTNDVANFTSCKKFCQPGEFSPNGLAPCNLCGPGTYSDKYRSTSCKACPSGTTTVVSGAKSQYECGSRCRPGTYSDTGVEPCQPCPRGSFQQGVGQLRCIDCPDLLSTFSEGSENPGYCTYIDFCQSSPCLNSGHCVNLKGGYRCECKDGFYGHSCQMEVNECALRPCINDGKCIDKFREYLCVCQRGSLGKNCETLYGVCDTNRCGSHGQCRDLPDNKFQCVCNDGYIGQFCEEKVNPCAVQPCKNNAVCLPGKNGDFTCQCLAGYGGKGCEVKLDTCASDPCRNGAACKDGPHGYTCTCLAGYGGDQCQIKHNMCVYTPCKNGGVCTGLVNDVKCLCAPGYGGKHCERKLSGDFDLSFQTRTSPSFSSVNGRNDLRYITLAFWMRTSDDINSGTPISYAVNGPGGDNALTLSDYSNFELTINNVSVSLDFGANDGEWHHVAITWASSSGAWFAYLDGKEVKRSTAAFQKNQVIKKGGIFVLGEEQDELGGGFTPAESFYGDLSQLHIWNRVLSADEIYDLASNCKHASGNVVTWADFNEENRGNIVKTSPSLACSFVIPTNIARGKPTKQSSTPYGGGWGASYKAVDGNRNPSWGGYSCTHTHYQGRAWWRVDLGGSYSVAKVRITNRGDCCSYRLSNFDIKVGNTDNPNGNALCKYTQGSVGSGETRDFQCPQSLVGRYVYVVLRGANYLTLCEVEVYPPVGNVLREFQQLKRNTLPSSLSSSSKTAFQSTSDVSACAKTCAKTYSFWCRAFVYDKNAKRCTFYSKSILVNGGEPLPNDNLDLYQLSCVKPLGMSSGRIKDSQISSLDFYGSTRPQMARLFNVPLGTSTGPAHWSPKSSNSYLEVNLGKLYKITGVATQGHFDSNTREWAASYALTYRTSSGSWVSYNRAGTTVFPANTDSATVVRNEIYLEATALRIYPRVGGSRVALRMEIYGCSMTPQGVPEAKSDSNQCNGNPCLNGGACIDLYKRYKCICAVGYQGSRCEQKAMCPAPEVPVNGKIATINTDQVRYACNSGFTLSGSQIRYCRNGNYQGSVPRCIANPCASKPCSHGCMNSNGQYRCYCPRGFSLGSDKRTCQDINECNTNNGGCSHACANFAGDYRCTCKNGYKLVNKLHCLDIDECSANHGCSQDCENTLGSYKCSCKSGYTLASNGKTCNQNRCPNPAGISNGKIVSSSAMEVNYQCNAGYKLQGSARRICHPDGRWSGVHPSCTRVSCVTLKAESTKIQVSGRSYGTVARYSCSSPLRLVGPSQQTCQQSGMWSGLHPRCIESKCPLLSNPVNGKILGAGSTTGSVIRVQCNQGYRLVQTNLELRTCHSNGQWTGGNSAAVQCRIIDCGQPPRSSSYVQVTLHGNTYYQGRATYTCSQNGGQRCLEGPTVRVCGADGKWSGKEPTCEANSCCKPKNIPKHSTFYSDNIFRYSYKVYIECDKGYKVGGTDFRTCQNNGQWTGTDTTCTIVDCGDPGSVSNGVRIGDSTTYKSEVKYFCNPGFKHVGSRTRVCQANGKWTGTAASCVASFCGGHKRGHSGSFHTSGGKTECHWLLQVNQGKKVTIQISNFNMGDNDRVEIYDGQSYEPFITFRKNASPRQITGNSHFMRVIYIGGDNPGSGFSLNFKEATCGGLIGSESGVITSPGYPVRYHANDECFWTIHRPYDKVELQFKDFKLQESIHDYVEVTEGPFVSSKMLLFQRYGRTTPSLLRDWADRWLWIHFKADGHFQYEGFKALYRVYIPREV